MSLTDSFCLYCKTEWRLWLTSHCTASSGEVSGCKFINWTDFYLNFCLAWPGDNGVMFWVWASRATPCSPSLSPVKHTRKWLAGLHRFYSFNLNNQFPRQRESIESTLNTQQSQLCRQVLKSVQFINIPDVLMYFYVIWVRPVERERSNVWLPKRDTLCKSWLFQFRSKTCNIGDQKILTCYFKTSN